LKPYIIYRPKFEELVAPLAGAWIETPTDIKLLC